MRRKVVTALAGITGGFVLLAVIGAIAGAGMQPAPAAAVSAAHSLKPARAAAAHPAARARTPGKPKARTVSAEAACDARGFASDDIYVRWEDPGVLWTAQQLGGEWVWDVSTHTCKTSVQMMISSSPPGAGNCTQVGYVADNPGYDVNAVPAAPLEKVAAQTGPAC